MAVSFLYLAIFIFLAVFVGLRQLLKLMRKVKTPRLPQLLHIPVPASVTPPRSLWKYDVFLSFRGTDVRRRFVSHLYEAFNKEGIKAFHDERELQRGNFIWEGLEKAIDQSRIAIVVISKGYATSHWCLQELSLMADLAKKKRIELTPIFYDIDPSDLKIRSGCFNKALEKYEQRYDLETVSRWRRALAEVGNISGWESKSRNEESELVHEVVRDLSDRLFSHSSSDDTDGLVGMISHLRSIESLLSMDSGDVRMVGIWGMGGIGKTTIAKFVCKRLSSKFDGACLLENVNKEFEQYGSSHIRRKMLSEILRKKNLMNSWDGDSAVMKRRLRGIMVLIVLDNVDNVEQLQELVGSLEWFAPGSKIIITTRDKRVLEQYDVEHIYEVKPLRTTQALQLFSKYAFKQPRPPKDSAKLSIGIVKQLGGLPLAIRVAGAALYRRDIADWEDYLDLLRTNVNSSISKALRESFEALNKQEKLTFLYVACCFNGKHMNRFSKVLDLFDVSRHRPLRSVLCIKTLAEKCLINISTTKRIWVHDLLQDMARDIICEGKEENPWKRKMLWNFMDINNVLCENMGSEAIEVESLLLDMSKGNEIYISPAIFERMYNLKLLKFYNNSTAGGSKICMPDGLVYLPMLRYLHWQAYTLKSLPSRFCTTYLVELNLPNSLVKTLWNGTQDLGNLRSMNLSGCKRLLEIPDLSEATSLEKLNLGNCESLVELTDSLRHLNNLGVLDLRSCKKLKKLPNNINLRSLRTLHLERCSSLGDFPFVSENVKKISLDETAIEEVPASIERLTHLKTLHLSGCKKLKNLPDTIRNMDSLTILWLSDCPNITLFPEVGDNIESLALKGTSIEEVPANIGDKPKLIYLNVTGCQKLKNLPPKLRNLTRLKFLSLRGFTNITLSPETWVE